MLAGITALGLSRSLAPDAPADFGDVVVDV